MRGSNVVSVTCRIAVATLLAWHGGGHALAEEPAGPRAASSEARLKPATDVSGTGTTNYVTKWTDTSGTLANSLMYDSGSGVGIGTQSPVSLLHLAATNGAAAVTFNTYNSVQKLRFQTLAGIPNWGGMTMNAIYNSGWILDDTTLNGWFFKLDSREGNGASANNGLWLYRIPNGANPHADETALFGVTNGRAYFAGKVGIGTVLANDPDAQLQVVGTGHFTGNLTVDGNLAAKYQDVAEWVPAAHGISPGTVVVLDRDRRNSVIPSHDAYDTAVAGVVSAQPGITLGEGSPDKAKVATTGRVKVRVDASKHPVAIGDLLVTSDTPGMAMYSEPLEIHGRQFHQPGTVIGKALEPLESGREEILVLLSLQ